MWTMLQFKKKQNICRLKQGYRNAHSQMCACSHSEITGYPRSNFYSQNKIQQSINVFQWQIKEHKRNRGATYWMPSRVSQYLILFFDYSRAIFKNPILEVFTISITKEKTAFLFWELLQTLFLYQSRSCLPSDYGPCSCSSEIIKSSWSFWVSTGFSPRGALGFQSVLI